MVGQTLSMMRQAALTTKKVEIELDLLEAETLHDMQGCEQDNIAILQAKLAYLEHQLEIAAINVQMEIAENMELMAEAGIKLGRKMEEGMLGNIDDDDAGEEQGGEAQS